MALDDTAWKWEPISAIQVTGGAALWRVEFALALYQGEYYLRVQTWKAGHVDAARVRLVGPDPYVMRALAAIQGLVRAATSTIEGAKHTHGSVPALRRR